MMPQKEKMYFSGNPAAQIFRKIMSDVHAGLPYRSFPEPEAYEEENDNWYNDDWYYDDYDSQGQYDDSQENTELINGGENQSEQFVDPEPTAPPEAYTEPEATAPPEAYVEPEQSYSEPEYTEPEFFEP